MASQGQDVHPRTSAKATNRGGRPRKYATVAEARAHEIEKQRLKRHQHQQLQSSKLSQQIPGELQFVIYQPQVRKPVCDLFSQAAQKDEERELHISTSKNTLADRLDGREVVLGSLAHKVGKAPIEGSQESEGEPSIDSETNENAPVLRLFDHVVAGGHRNIPSRLNGPGSIPGTTCALSPSLSPKLENLRKTFAALLPPQRDLDLIVAETDAWALLKPICILLGNLYVNYDLTSLFNMRQTSTCHPTIIARSLIYISLSIQQLPPDFKSSRLSFSHSIDTVLLKYTNAVSELITSNDELAGSIEGLECGILLTFFHINAGNLQRAWLPCRKALNIAQMKGFHRDRKKLSELLGPTRAMVSKTMWHKIVGLDRFLAIILGLPAGSKCDKFGPDENVNNPNMNPDTIFLRRLSNIANAIIERNEDDSGKAFTMTQDIVEKMDMLQKEMPKGYWEIPRSPTGKRFEADDVEYLRLTSHIWFFHLEGFLHLPYMLRAATEPRYDYNNARCLDSSRELIVRYLAIKQDGPSICCKIVDFAGFTAGIILVLHLISSFPQSGSFEMSSLKDQDKDLLERLIACFENLASDPREVVAAQSVVVIKKILAANSCTSGETKLTIPYVGAITIVHQAEEESQPQRQPSQPKTYSSKSVDTDLLYSGEYQHDITPNQIRDCNGMTPVVSFISSQFGSVNLEPTISDLGWTEAYSAYLDNLSAFSITSLDHMEY